MSERATHYQQRSTGILYPIGDLFGYPDSLIRARTGAAYQYGLQLIDNTPKTVLDFGSGRGHGIQAINNILHPERIVSLDPHFGSLVTQRMGLNLNTTPSRYRFVNANDSLPLADGKFDAVTIMHVIEHIKNPKSLLNYLHQALTPNGQLLLATPDARNLVGYNPYDEHVFDDKEIIDLFESSGFAPELYFVKPNERAHRFHKRKQWLGTHASYSTHIRDRFPKTWEKVVFRSGISGGPLFAEDFSLSKNYDPSVIDLLVVAKKASNPSSYPEKNV